MPCKLFSWLFQIGCIFKVNKPTFAAVPLFIELVSESIDQDSLVRLTLSKPKASSSQLQNVYVRPVQIKDKSMYSFTYRYQTQDQVKNYDAAATRQTVNELLSTEFQNAVLVTNTEEINLLTTKKGISKVSRKKTQAELGQGRAHDRAKNVQVDLAEHYLRLLHVTDENGNLIPRMADKYRQINKYLEITEHLIQTADLPDGKIQVVDMGSGKGYLTFALYNYLTNELGLQMEVMGVEQRSDLVKKCNEAADACHFDKLKFVESSIQDFHAPAIDMLIALHACDTATDDAIAKGINSGARIIICAPCCHKQIRQQLKGKNFQSPILKYGIYKERLFEMVTDTIRSLLLELHGYKTNLFEFISSEHTNKNIMLTAVRSGTVVNKKEVHEKIAAIKKEFQIDFHYLEKLMGID